MLKPFTCRINKFFHVMNEYCNKSPLISFALQKTLKSCYWHESVKIKTVAVKETSSCYA